MSEQPPVYTEAQWKEITTKRFGEDPLQWKFICPVCKYVASVAEWKEAGAPEGAVGFSCVGRWKKLKRDAFDGSGPGPCNYAGGGLFQLNPIYVERPDGKVIRVFDWAPADA